MAYQGNAAQWNQLVQQVRYAPFLQSVQWGAFQESLGRAVKYYARGDAKSLHSVGLMICHDLPKGLKYWYLPRGPVGPESDEILADALTDARNDMALFVKIDPPRAGEAITVEQSVAARALQPQTTSVVDLSSTPETLLSAMHHKTRYNIKLAQRHGVVVTRYAGESKSTGKALEDFLSLLAVTAARDEFSLHEAEYYRALFSWFTRGESDTPRAALYLATYQGAVVAGSMTIDFGDTVTYLHGASADVHREVMAPYLVQWTAILDAKAVGYRYYDFWGIAPAGAKNHPWAGVTRFKQGFGGVVVQYPESRDIILRPWWYRVYRFSQIVRGRR